MSQKFCKLVMVAVSDGKDPKKAAQSNKYYLMEEKNGMLEVTYGRVESTASHETYPMSRWDSKYREKIKKGYVDTTFTVTEQIKNEPEKEVKLGKIEEAKVETFLNLMQKYTKGLVAQTYTVKAKDVTVAQVQEAQKILTGIMSIKKNDVTSINSELLKLYMIIPRKMQDVRDYLLPNIKLDKTLEQEQDNIDAMSSQVQIEKKEVKPKVQNKVAEKTLLDLLGLDKMTVVQPTREIDYLVKQITGKKTEAIFEVVKSSEEKRFKDWLTQQTDKRTTFLFHGTKTSSLIPILEQGLKIRPSGNFQFSGKVYGDGNYFSKQFSTSIGYTGGGSDLVMLIYEVHTGKASSSSFTNYNHCKSSGYDSFQGSWLNVAYKEEQCKVKYVIWLK